MKGLIAKKVGMTQIFDESGNLTPVTVIQVEPNVVIAKKEKEYNRLFKLFFCIFCVLTVGSLTLLPPPDEYAGQGNDTKYL